MNKIDYINEGKQILRDKDIVETDSFCGEKIMHASVPGLGGVGRGISFSRNKSSLLKYCIKHRMLSDHFSPETNTNFFGQDIKIPIIAAPMSGIKTSLKGVIQEIDFHKFILEGCTDAGTIGMCGDSYDTTAEYHVPELLKDVRGIAVCKPRILSEIENRIHLLNVSGVYAIGIDIDGAAGMLLEAGKVTKKNPLELKKIRSLFNGPMFLKGIMSVEDALTAHQAGFDGIVVSNHGGRSIDYSLGTADILPAISSQLKGKIIIMVDGGVASGYDAFIYLALGADVVLSGRSILYSVVAGGRTGVTETLNKFTSELRRAMLFSGCRKISDITSEVIEKYE
ncbi:MAG: alpha-hydroxy-acid oxidizing protein [Bdellovibrionales bacterium]|nr:alpha-hydroxy-acid oxidizing protein [Bdellovibrionales bacterium]